MRPQFFECDSKDFILKFPQVYISPEQMRLFLGYGQKQEPISIAGFNIDPYPRFNTKSGSPLGFILELIISFSFGVGRPPTMSYGINTSDKPGDLMPALKSLWGWLKGDVQERAKLEKKYNTVVKQVESDQRNLNLQYEALDKLSQDYANHHKQTGASNVKFMDNHNAINKNCYELIDNIQSQFRKIHRDVLMSKEQELSKEMMKICREGITWSQQQRTALDEARRRLLSEFIILELQSIDSNNVQHHETHKENVKQLVALLSEHCAKVKDRGIDANIIEQYRLTENWLSQVSLIVDTNDI